MSAEFSRRAFFGLATDAVTISEVLGSVTDADIGSAERVAETREDVEAAIRHLARAVREHAGPVLSGHRAAFRSARRFRAMNSPGIAGDSKL